MRIDTPEFTTWMRARPRPDKVKAFLETGSSRTVKVRPRKGVRYWKEVVDALSAYEVQRVELLDEEGNVLRHMTVEATEDPPETLERPAGIVPTTQAQGYVERESQLVVFARLLKEAYTTGASMQRDSSKDAFDKLVALTETAFRRVDMLEKAYSRLYGKQLRKITEGDDEDDTEKEAGKMVHALVAKQLGVAPETTNGSGTAPNASAMKDALKTAVAEAISELQAEAEGTQEGE